MDKYLELIHRTVFDQDIVGIILFIRFGKDSEESMLTNISDELERRALGLVEHAQDVQGPRWNWAEVIAL